MIRFRPLLFAVAAASAPAIAHAESLPEVLAYAYENNPGIQAQRAALRALDESYVQARAGYGLTANVSVGATSYELRRGTGRADAETDNQSLSVTQPLYTGGRVHARLRAAEAQIRAGREQLRRAELDLIQRVTAAYVAVRRDEQLLFLARDTVRVLEQYYSDTQARAEVRTVTMTDLQQSRARLAQARTQAIAIEEQLAVSRAQFLAAVGRSPGTLDPPPPLDQLPASIDEAFNAAEANSPQLLAATYTEEASRARVSLARAAGMPNVAARFEMRRDPQQPYLPGPHDESKAASVVLSQPLLSGGQIRSGVRQAVEENTRDRLTLEDTRLQVIQNVAMGWERLVSLRRQMSTLEEEVSANELAFYGVREEEKFALRSNIEVLNAAAELSNAQQNLARTRAAEYVARVQLLAVTGVLTPTTLAPAAAPYDPSANFRRVKDRGSTPLEWPVRALDSLAAPPIGSVPPPTLPAARPAGSAKEETPVAEKPLRSSYELLSLEATSPEDK